MAATVNTAGGRFTAAPKRRRPGTRRKLSPSMQWLLSFLLMIVIFATYFVLCLLLTPYNLFSMYGIPPVYPLPLFPLHT